MILSEIHLTCIISFGLITIFLIFLLPKYTGAGPIHAHSRKLLAGSTTLITLHFILQYILGKYSTSEDLATIINLMFGIPVSHLIFMSYYYVQKQGDITKRQRWTAPLLFVLQCVILAFGLTIDSEFTSYTIPALSMILALMLIRCFFLLTKQYLTIRKEIRLKSDIKLYPFMLWTRRSMLLMMLVFIWLPFSTFFQHPFIRSSYDFIFLASTFFYIICFIGYCVTNKFDYMLLPQSASAVYEKSHGFWLYHTRQREKQHHKSRTSNNLKSCRIDSPALSWGKLQYTYGPGITILSPSQQKREKRKKQKIEEKTNRLNAAKQRFFKEEIFTRPHLTKKEAAHEMQISMAELDRWLTATEYKKFNTWLIHLRIEKSKALMTENPNLTCDEIAFQCGFCDRQYFQLQFTKFEGITPTKWMKKQ